MTVQYGFFGDNATAAIDCLLKGQYVSGSCEPDQSAQQMGCSDLPKGKRKAHGNGKRKARRPRQTQGTRLP